MHRHMGASTPAIKRLCELCQSDRPKEGRTLSIATINRLFMLTLPAHLQLNHGDTLDPNHRDALRAEIIRSALNPETRQ